jgi:adenylate cyclase
VGVTAGYVTIIAPLTLPAQAPEHPIAWVNAVGVSVFSALNLLVLARTRRYERYVTALLSSGVVIIPIGTMLGGGLTGSSGGLIYGFLLPAYALMALGAQSAKRWFIVYLAMAGVLIAIDPFVHQAFTPASYPVQLFGEANNALLPVTVVFLLMLYTDSRRRAAEARADTLLTNAIPRSIATRLRRGEERIAESYRETTVVFADIANFTPWAQRTDPARVVALLDDLFTRFDELATTHRVEKIKTIGDAYMAVAGAPEAREDHASAAVAFAQALLAAAADWRNRNDVPLELRAGAASGSVVGGIIGSQRMLFDLWGDTVNVAARMESFGLPGRLQISESTWKQLPDQSGWTQRQIDIKGLGVVTAYLLQP